MAKKLKTLEDLLLMEIQDLYDAEHRILKALPKLAKKASHSELSAAFEEHLEQTQSHVVRLENVFKILGEKPKRKTCEGIKGLLKEGDEALEEPMENDVRDAAMIGAAQRVEHYEMAGYGCAKTFASRLGYDDAADLLQQTLDEEAETDQKLTGIAESAVNEDAMRENREMVGVR